MPCVLHILSNPEAEFLAKAGLQVSPMIDVQGISKVFTVHQKDPGLWGSVKSLVVRKRIEKHAVKEVSFHIGEGEIVGLIGANGAGKTTLVKMLAGIIHPTGGDALVLGHRPWERNNEFRRQIALIMGQKAQLWWDLPAADCFLLLQEIYRIPKDEYDRRIAELARILDVKDLLTTQIRRLSLGERMKMELIAALLHSPRVVFLDEPTIGLDVSAQRAIREFLLTYQSQNRPAMILTSHYMEDIERLCQRIIIIRTGEIVYDGPLDRVVKQFATHKVVTAHLLEGAEVTQKKEALGRIGNVVECNDQLVKLHVTRDQVAQSAARLAELVPISDLSIEEEDIGVIIGNILTAKAEVSSP